jgi:hypothetical protein
MQASVEGSDLIAAFVTRRYCINESTAFDAVDASCAELPPVSRGIPMRSITRKALVVAVAALPAQLLAQGLTIQSVTDVRFQGALGTFMNMAAKFGGGGTPHDAPTTTYLSGHKLRTESGTTATIIDADAGRFTTIDNKAKTYQSFTFDDMAEIMRRAQESAKADAAKQTPSPKAAAKSSTDPKGDVNVKYRVETDRPGDHEKIAGYNAERIFLTIYIDAEATPENGKTEQAGSLVLLLDQWISKDAPQSAAMAEFRQAYAQKAGQAFKAQTQSLSAAFNAEPRLKGGLEAASKEMAKLQGTPLRSTMYFTLVPPTAPFDRKLALSDVAASNAKEDKANAEEKPKGGGGFGGMIGKLKAAAEEANKQDKQGDKKGDKTSNDPPKQTTIVTMKDEVRSITPGPVSADLFAPPAGYREIKRQMPPAN